MKDIKTLFRDSDGKMTMTVGETGSFVSGVERLAQHVTNILLTDKNTNILHPNAGADLKSITSVGASSGSDVEMKKSQIVAGVMATENYIRDSQSGEPLTDDEKLLSLNIVRLQYNTSSREWNIDILIETVSGDVFIATIN